MFVFRCVRLFGKFQSRFFKLCLYDKSDNFSRNGFKIFPDGDLRICDNQAKGQWGFESTDRHIFQRLCALGKYIDAILPGLKNHYDH